MARRRSARRRGLRLMGGIAVLILGAAGFYYAYYGGFTGGARGTGEALAILPPKLTSDRPGDGELEINPYPEVAQKGAAPQAPPTPAVAAPDTQHARQVIESARKQAQSGNPIAARQQLSDGMKLSPDAQHLVDVRAELVRLGEETIFSRRVYADDPLVAQVIVPSGETLQKIARAHDVTAALLARINGIADPNMIRQGQTLKVVKGPFHVRVAKSAFRMDIYLQDTFVQSFPVGLGAEDGTPSGEWRVTEKLANPTYYPPRGGRKIAADDPENPLGERWIGLEGVAGAAKGQMRYGIHGTIDPDSIGKSVSMGCIRLHNADVELLYDLLTPAKSKVEVVD